MRDDGDRRLGTVPGVGDDVEQQCRVIVERVRSYPMSGAARTGILAEIEATYRRERAQGAAVLQRRSTSSL